MRVFVAGMTRSPTNAGLLQEGAQAVADPETLPSEPRVQIDRAAELTVAHLGAPSGVVTVVDPSDPG